MTRIWIAVGLSVALAACAQGKSAAEGQPLASAAVATPATDAPPATAPKTPDAVPASALKTPEAGSDAAASTSATPQRTPAAAAKRLDRAPEFREVTLPAGTLLPVELNSSVGSDSSHAEDEVLGTLRRAVRADGIEVLPAGTKLRGHVTSARHSAKVKGRASVGFRFTQIDLPGAGGRSAVSTGTIVRVAPGTKKEDAAKIGGGAAGGAIIGGILGGAGGAAKGAAIGGTAGTGVVLATKGKEVHLGPGAALSAKLTAPLTVRVPLK